MIGLRIWLSTRWLLSAWALGVFACAGLTGCPVGAGPLQGVRVHCPNPSARVFINGRFVGVMRQLKGRVIRLKRGRHRIEIRKQGFFARYRQVRIRRGEVQDLRVKLHRELE